MRVEGIKEGDLRVRCGGSWRIGGVIPVKVAWLMMMDCEMYIYPRLNVANVLREWLVKDILINMNEIDVDGIFDRSIFCYIFKLRDPFYNLDQIRRDAHCCDCTTCSTKPLALHLSIPK